jgi:4-amino-4-deoxy-L-arabinose transferase-like glycosyltransferase
MYRIKKFLLFDSPTYVDWVIYFTAFVILQVPAIINFYYNDGHHNAYIQLTQSLMEGHFNLPETADKGDLCLFNGKLYLPYPPLPSLILIPFVLLFGAAHVNTVAIATAMSCLCLYLLYQIFIKLKIDKEQIPWLILAVFFGTGFWFALFTTHHVYAFAHITSFLFQLLFLNEILGKRRWWLAGVFIGCAFLSRQFTVFYVLFALGYMFYLHKNGKTQLRWKSILSFSASLGFFVALYFAYNYVRFGKALDSGYNYIVFIGVLKERVHQFGVFNIRYFLFNLYCVLIKGFNIQFTGNGYLTVKDMDLWGTSLFAASPFLVAGFRANWPKILKISAWVTIIVILVGQLFYHNNGYEQINTSRFTLDFLPLLIVLTALGSAKVPLWLMKGMIAYAVGLNIVSFIIHLMYG